MAEVVVLPDTSSDILSLTCSLYTSITPLARLGSLQERVTDRDITSLTRGGSIGPGTTIAQSYLIYLTASMSIT